MITGVVDVMAMAGWRIIRFVDVRPVHMTKSVAQLTGERLRAVAYGARVSVTLRLLSRLPLLRGDPPL